jgi:hypothetical protein
MRGTHWIVLAMAVAVLSGCAASDLKARKDDAWSQVPQALPDGLRPENPSVPRMSKLPDPYWANYEPVPNGYGHPFRPLGFVFHPIGVALDWALVKPFYMLGGLAPEWFGLTAEDAQRFQGHQPELRVPKTEPRRFID